MPSIQYHAVHVSKTLPETGLDLASAPGSPISRADEEGTRRKCSRRGFGVILNRTFAREAGMIRRFLGRREFLILGAAGRVCAKSSPLATIIIRVNVMFDRGAHSAHGLTEPEIHLFQRYQEQAGREYTTSGIAFELHFTEGAFLRTQGYSEIPDRFLAPKMINLFVTDALGYDIDHGRTGGSSIGPRPRRLRTASDPFYKTFVGLRDANETTLSHEYAHHFSGDTRQHPSVPANLWCDLRNDYWLWRQRHGSVIAGFRVCANAEWATVASNAHKIERRTVALERVMSMRD
jgi:hypothetical protein